MIAMLWAQKVISGEKSFLQVPRLLKERVRDILTTSGFADLITEQGGD